MQNYPSYNIIKIDDDNYRVELALGFSQNDISIETNSNILTIEAKKTEDNEYIYKASLIDLLEDNLDYQL